MPKYYNPKNPNETGDYPEGQQPQGWVLSFFDSGDSSKPRIVTYQGVPGIVDNNNYWHPIEGLPTKTEPDPSRFLGAQGYNWLEGYGPSALWKTPSGQVVTQDIATALATKAATTTPASTDITPGQAAQIGLGYAQLAQSGRQFDVTEARRAAEFAVTSGITQKQIDQQNKVIAETQVQNQFLRNMQSFQANQGMTKEANETKQRLFENQMSLQTMQNQRNALQAQLNMQASVENARNQLANQQANLQYQAQREARLQSLAGDIGKLAADPGSRAQLAATLLANRGWGQAPGALRQSQITEESLQPLAQDLELRKSIEAQPLNPYQFTPIQAPQLAPMGDFALPAFTTTTAPVPTAPIPATGGTTLSYAQQAEQANKAMQDAGVPSWVPSFSSAPPPTSVDTSGGTNSGGGTTGLALGGLTRSGQFIVGDSKSGRPTGYEELIINPTGAPIKVIPNNEVQRYYGGTSVPRYAIGTTGTGDNPSDNGGTSLAGFFSGINRTDAVKGPEDGVASWETNQPSDQMPATTYVPTADNTTANENASTAAARSFLAEALNKALTGTPWKSTNLPTSVYASTPGMDPVVAQLMASLNAMARGVPESTFLRQASLLAPSGMSQSVTRRTG